MVLWIRNLAVVVLVLAAVLSAMAGVPLPVPFVLAAMAAPLVLVAVVRVRPERAALTLAVVTIAGGTLATGVRVADGVADSRVQFRGELDVQEILRSFHPRGPVGLGDPLSSISSLGYGYMSSGHGEMTKPRATPSVLVMWSVGELAPWLLAATVFGLLLPLLRAAEHGDPFRRGSARRLAAIGMLVLVGIPGIAVIRYIAALVASEGHFVSPTIEPALTLSTIHVLPGVLVLVLAGVFRRGAELRDFERHAI